MLIWLAGPSLILALGKRERSADRRHGWLELPNQSLRVKSSSVLWLSARDESVAKSCHLGQELAAEATAKRGYDRTVTPKRGGHCYREAEIEHEGWIWAEFCDALNSNLYRYSDKFDVEINICQCSASCKK